MKITIEMEVLDKNATIWQVESAIATAFCRAEPFISRVYFEKFDGKAEAVLADGPNFTAKATMEKTA